MAAPKKLTNYPPNDTHGVDRLAASGGTRKRISLQPSLYKVRVSGKIRDLALPKLTKSGQSLEDALVVRHESPWTTHTKIYECDLAGQLDIASYRVQPSCLVAIKTVQVDDIGKTLRFLETMQHPNVLSTQQCFVYQGLLSISYRDVQISLDHLAACEAYLDEVQLAAVLGQVLDGLLYLASEQIQHPRVSSSTVLMTSKGEVKIGAIEECVEHDGNGPPNYFKALEMITMEMMQKYVIGDNKAGLDNIARWPCDSKATDFLSSVESGIPLRTLRNHPLFTSTHWTKGHLLGLVSFALRSSFTFCSYTAEASMGKKVHV